MGRLPTPAYEKRRAKAIGKRIRQLRETAGIERDHLAKVLGVSAKTMERIEGGMVASLLPGRLERIAGALGHSIADVYGDPAETAKAS